MKYNVGDKVRVRSDLGREHGAVIEMIKMAGKEVTISKVVEVMEAYFIEEDPRPIPFLWSDWMFEEAPVTPVTTDKLPKLTTGMFGKERDGELFVVVGDNIVYQGGMCEDTDWMQDNMEDEDGEIIELYEARCFKQIADGKAKLIWKRSETEVKDESKVIKEDKEDKKDGKPELDDFLGFLEFLASCVEEKKDETA